MRTPSLPRTLAPPLRAAFAVELRRKLGLVFPPTRAEAFEGGIVRAASALKEVPAALLLRLADGDRAVIEALALELTIGETYFFRHPHHFEFLREALRKLQSGRAKDDPIRVWSAGCSSGEEAYSMAIAALEALGPSAQDRVEILGTDLNAACLERARAATYGAWSFRNVAPAVRAQWFEPRGAQLRVASAPRSMVRFVSRNLLDGPPPAGPSAAWSHGIDLIFCRNVLIYFDPEAIERVTEVLARALMSGGLMVPGPSDPLLRSSHLVVSTTSGLISYRRPSQEPEVVAARRERPPGSYAPAPLPEVKAPIAAPAPVTSAEPVATIAAGPTIDRARRLADSGDSAAALALIDDVIASDPLQGEAYALRAVLAAAAGDHARAAAEADRAILVQSAFAFAHVIAAMARTQLGERAEARRHLRNAQRLLSALEADASVPGSGGVAARELLDICQQLTRRLAAPRVARATGARR
jgi:chemotaxis protein methyltransferase CheR